MQDAPKLHGSGADMTTDKSKLQSIVEGKFEVFKKEARKHKRLHRYTWWATTFVSLAIAFSSNYDFAIGPSIDSDQVAGVLGIVLPAVTAYIVLRSPERLWILEIQMRNRLSDLKDRIELAYERDPNVDSASFETELFEILDDANNRWTEIKLGGS